MNVAGRELAGPPRARRLAWLAVALMAIEFWPRPIPATRLGVPPYVAALQAAPAPGALFDPVTPEALAMHYQTYHGRPIAFGYLARKSPRVVAGWHQLRRWYDRREFQHLYEKGYRFVLMPADQPAPPGRRIYADAAVALYDLGAPATNIVLSP